jgi:hypothetical protein
MTCTSIDAQTTMAMGAMPLPMNSGHAYALFSLSCGRPALETVFLSNCGRVISILGVETAERGSLTEGST